MWYCGAHYAVCLLVYLGSCSCCPLLVCEVLLIWLLTLFHSSVRRRRNWPTKFCQQRTPRQSQKLTMLIYCRSKLCLQAINLLYLNGVFNYPGCDTVSSWATASPSALEMTSFLYSVYSKLEEILQLSNHGTDLKEAATLDYYVAGVWWAKQQGFSIEQLSSFFTLIHTVLQNVKGLFMGSVQLLTFLPLSCAVGYGIFQLQKI